MLLKDLIEDLPQREKKVIVLRYYRDKTQRELANELGVSQDQVSRIENKVLQKLKDGMENWLYQNVVSSVRFLDFQNDPMLDYPSGVFIIFLIKNYSRWQWLRIWMRCFQRT